MKIAVDAMGGDHAPEAVVEGSLLAEPQCGAKLVLVGDGELLGKALAAAGTTTSVGVVHASQAIGMAESGPVAIRRKRESSINVAMRLLAAGEVDAVVSAGNSAAVVAASKHIVGLVTGLRRPAMVVPLPTLEGKLILLDAGAHAEADTIHLVQSAALAHVYLKVTEGLNHPRIGLLNIGQEPGKGLKVIRRAFTLLERSNLRFIGNIEAHDLAAGKTDAVICGGFAGNVLLKTYEGLSETLYRFIEFHVEGQQAPVQEALRRILHQYQRAFHYQAVGGAPLLGICKPVVVSHGRSEGPAIANAIRAACRMAEERVCERMCAELENDSTLAEFKHQNTLLLLENLRSKWGFAQK